MTVRADDATAREQLTHVVGRRACGCILNTRLCTCVCNECYPEHRKAVTREIRSRSRFTGVDMQDCDCFCDHTARCENGCYPEDAEPQLEWSEWTCIGGTKYKLTDTRED